MKTRILAGGIHSAKQQVVRIDRETGWPLDDAVSARVRDEARAARSTTATRVLLSDYGSGLVTPALADAIRRASRAARGAGRCRCSSTRATACSTIAA